MTTALDGVRVVDLTAGLAGPVAGMLLADLGADVIKVYPPGGGPSAAVPGQHMWDRGKRSVVADPARPADLAALDELIGRADVVLMGAGGDGHVGHADLAGRGLEPGRPALWIVLPPYLLDETPWAGGGRAESAGLLFAWAGHAWSQASYDDVPVDCVFPVALIMQGIWGAINAVALLAGRQLGRAVGPLAVAGGRGAELVSPGGFAVARSEPHEHRQGGPGGTLANYRCYRCGDGQWLFFGAFTNAFIQRGFTAVGAGWILADPRIGGDIGRVRQPENIGWVTRELEQAFASQTRTAVLAALQDADCPAAPAGQHGRLAGPRAGPGHRAAGAAAQRRGPGHRDARAADRAVADPDRAARPGPDPAPGHHPAQRGLGAARPGRRRAGRDRGAGRGGPPEPPLAGLRVLNLGTIIAGPYSSTMLGELGAEVWKIERPPHGDEFRTSHGGRGGAGFTVYNRDQRSLLLNLGAEPSGRRLPRPGPVGRRGRRQLPRRRGRPAGHRL